MLWVGSVNGMEQALVERAGIDYRAIRTGQLNGVGALTALRNGGKMVWGTAQSIGIVHAFRPHVCLVTGGYVCAPVALACRLLGVPVLIYLPDMTPGKAIQQLSRIATRVAVSFEGAAHFFGGLASGPTPGGKAVVTGYPVRQELIDAAGDRGAARRQLAAALDRPLNDDVPLVLIWGGSGGARSINRATWGSLNAVLPHAHLLHVVGARDWPLYEAWRDEAVANVGQNVDRDSLVEQRYHPVAYLHEEMVLALAAADLSVARAGASTLGEFPVARLPSILVPLPFVGVAQGANADALAARGAAVVIDDGALNDALAPTVVALAQDRARRSEMEAALSELAQPEAALNIARELVKLAG